jgi:hypothetical protein
MLVKLPDDRIRIITCFAIGGERLWSPAIRAGQDRAIVTSELTICHLCRRS